MSREQADQVALAVDNPFENKTWVKNAIAAGSIIPRTDTPASVRMENWLWGMGAIIAAGFVVVGILVFIAAAIIRW